MPKIHELVRVRPEVVEGDLHGIVSLFALLSEDPEAFEKDANRVLASTFPSETLKRLLHRLRISLSGEDSDRKGLFVFSGGYGSGKSHLLLTLYHLLRSPQVGSAWLAANGLEFEPPEDTVVLLLPMNQLTMPGKDGVDYLWEPIFAGLGYEGFVHTGSNFPTAHHLQQAVNGRRVFLIIDEIERWFMPIKDPHQAEANLTFLQNLTEFSQDPTNGVFAVVTLLMLDPRLQTILGRVDAFREDLTQAPDRRQIVLHRLVESVDRDAAAPAVEAYLDQYKLVDTHVGLGDYMAYREEMLTCYPFHPATIEAVFERYSSVASLQVTSYQNSRGALYLLAHALREAVAPAAGETSRLAKADLLLVGDLSLTNRRLRDDLMTLDPQLVSIARSNVESSSGAPHADSLLSVVLVHSLGDPQAKRRLGAEFGDLLLGMLRPDSSPASAVKPNEIQACLARLDDTALNLHREENPPRWLFKAEVNLQAQINRRARTETVAKQAPEEIVKALHDIVGGAVAVYPEEPLPDQRDITIVLSTKSLEPEEIAKGIYQGKAYPNGLVLVAPRSPGCILSDPDLLWIAQTMIAARQIEKDLVASGQQTPRVLRERASETALHKALPGRYGKWLTPVTDPATKALRFRGIDVKLDRGSILHEVEARYDAHHFEGGVMDAVRRRGQTPPTVDDIRSEFYRQRSYPKPVAERRASEVQVDRAIGRLVRAAELEVIVGGDAHYLCGKDPGVLQRTWTVAIPPEEHKPKFHARETILRLVKMRGAQGVRVGEVRSFCEREVANFPGESFDGQVVDDALRALIADHYLEAPSLKTVATGPFDKQLLIHPRTDEAGGGKVRLEFGPLTPQAVKIKVVQEIAKTDKLSEVAVDLTQQLKGKKVTESFGATLGLRPGHVTETTRLEVGWHLREAQVTDRDSLVQLLDGLPTEGDAQVIVRLAKESPKAEGEQQ